MSPSMTPAWIVYAWPTVLWQASCAPELQFVHLGTRVLTTREDACPCSGQTLWGSPSVERSAGVAWDWVEIQQGVVAMADPMSLITNLRLIDAHGEALSTREVTVQLHQMVHALPWQTEVRRALHLSS